RSRHARITRFGRSSSRSRSGASMPDHAPPHPDLGPYVLGLLAADDAEAFEDHLAACAECRDEIGPLAALPGLLEQAAPAALASAGLQARTLAAGERAARVRRARL